MFRIRNILVQILIRGSRPLTTDPDLNPTLFLDGFQGATKSKEVLAFLLSQVTVVH
jgi:hypothetical protein